MATSRPVRPIDPVALERVLRRMAGAPAPWLHAEVARRMAERLPLFKLDPSTVVDWWSHTGGGADALQAQYPRAQHIAVEPTAALAARRRGAASRPWWSAARWRQPAPQVVDAASVEGSVSGASLVWSNMMLHAVADPPALLARWHALLAVDGVAMFSCFGPDTVRGLSRLYAAHGWPAPTIPFVDLHDLGDMLVAAGYAGPVMDQETITLTWASAASALAELRGLGGNLSPQRHPGLATPRWRQRLERAMAQDGHDPAAPCALTFEITYGHAFKPPPRAGRGGEGVVSLDRLRTGLVKTLSSAPLRRDRQGAGVK